MDCSVWEQRRGSSIEASCSILSRGPMFADHIGPLYTGRSHGAGIAASLSRARCKYRGLLHCMGLSCMRLLICGFKKKSAVCIFLMISLIFR